MTITWYRYVLLAAIIIAGNTYAAISDRWSESYRHEAMGEYAKAAQAIEPIINSVSDHEFAIIRHGWLNYLQGKYNESIIDYKNALKINKDSLDANLGVTLPLLAQKRWREAAGFASSVLAVAPWNYFAHIRLMICEEGQGQWKSLELHADSAYKRFPSDPTILVYLARAKSRLGKDEQARQAYRKVLERVPGHLEARQFLNN